MRTISVNIPDTLLLKPGESLDRIARRSQFLLAAKFFELGELSSGQAAQMCGMNRIDFLHELGRIEVPVTDLTSEELEQEFRNA